MYLSLSQRAVARETRRLAADVWTAEQTEDVWTAEQTGCLDCRTDRMSGLQDRQHVWTAGQTGCLDCRTDNMSGLQDRGERALACGAGGAYLPSVSDGFQLGHREASMLACVVFPSCSERLEGDIRRERVYLHSGTVSRARQWAPQNHEFADSRTSYRLRNP